MHNIPLTVNEINHSIYGTFAQKNTFLEGK